LSEAVRRRPYSVILFDEVEKAHPDVFNVLLQVLDDGRITDGQGRTVDFKNTIIIFTSNIGSQNVSLGLHSRAPPRILLLPSALLCSTPPRILLPRARSAPCLDQIPNVTDAKFSANAQILDVSGSDAEAEAEMRKRVMEQMRRSFKPEFLNRLDEFIIFHPLGRREIRRYDTAGRGQSMSCHFEMVKVRIYHPEAGMVGAYDLRKVGLTCVCLCRIVEKHVKDVNHRLEDRSIVLRCTTSALDLIAENGYDPVYGARPLQRAVRRDIETPLAKELLGGR
jgi:ATP-dependent Clp protease ATP-binding subunit ClpA